VAKAVARHPPRPAAAALSDTTGDSAPANPSNTTTTTDRDRNAFPALLVPVTGDTA
jgi:hypothetical protein